MTEPMTRQLTRNVTRRRFITITASAVGAALIPPVTMIGSAHGQIPDQLAGQAQYWRGIALGAEASLTLNGHDPSRARIAIDAALDEISRLEKVFSLFRDDSALSRLNRDGVLEAPPLDLVVCLNEAKRYWRVTNGAFDATVQPLWALYGEHFSTSGADPHGPQDTDIAVARSLVDFGSVSLASNEIKFAKPGMALTLNGIAQGYITDKVTDLLRLHGFDHVLVNMGEIRALGGKADGTPWQVAINRTDQIVDIRNQAIATSGGYGTRFDEAGRYHHLLNPLSGRSANQWSSISVIAPTATMADGLSTAFYSLSKDDILSVSAELKVSVHAYDRDNLHVITPQSVSSL